MAQKNRKYERHSKRSPAAAQYRNTNRMVLNKEKNIKQDEAFKEKCAARKANKKIVRGYTRFLRRKSIQRAQGAN